MSTSRRSIRRFVARTLQIGVYAILFGTVVFFGLTRTEVGRDALRTQLEARFNAQFEGSLRIGALDGTLVNTLVARDIRLLAPDGSVVATVDSVAARPQWTSLLRRDVSVRALDIVRPDVRLHRYADGSWNWQRALRPATPAASASPLDWLAVRIDVHDGRVVTTRDGPAPSPVQERWTFDYSRATWTDISAAGSVEWTGATRQVGLQSLSVRMPDRGVSLASASGQLLWNDGTWSLPGATVRTSASALTVSGTWEAAATGPPSVDLEVAKSTLDFGEMQTLVPRLPLRDRITLSGEVYGPTDALVVGALSAERGASRVAVSGTVFGLPDSLDLDVTVETSGLRAADVQAVWPSAPQARLAALDSVAGTVYADGVVRWRNRSRPAFDLDTEADLSSPAGAVAGAATLSRSASAPLRYDVDVRTDSLNLAAVWPGAGLPSTLTGAVQASGQGVAAAVRRGSLRVALSRSQLGTQALDSLAADLTIAGRSVGGRVRAQQAGGGQLSAEGRVDLSPSLPRYRLALTGLGVDLAAMRPSLPKTQLQGQVTLNASGRSWDTLAGTLTADMGASTILRADSSVQVAPFRETLTVAPRGSPAPRIRLDGDVATGEVSGTVAARPIAALSRLWGTALRDAVQRELDKPMPASVARSAAHWAAPSASGPSPPPVFPIAHASKPPTSSPSVPASPDAKAYPDLRTAALNALRGAGLSDTLSVKASLQLHRSDAVRAWWPALPRPLDALDAQARMTAGPDTLATQVAVTARQVGLSAGRADSLQVAGSLTGSLRAPLTETLSAHLDIRTGRTDVWTASLRDLGASFRYRNRSGRLQVDARGMGTLGPLRLRANLDVRPDRNAVTIQDVLATVGDQAWTNAGPGRIDVYRSGVTVQPFRLESPRLFADGTQRLRVSGALTGASDDAIVVEGQSVSLYPIAQMMGYSRPLGGLIDGRLALTGDLQAAQLRSDVTVRRLSFDRRLLGQLQLSTTYRLRDAQVALDAAIAPEGESTDSLRTAASAVPGTLRRIEPSRLRMTGALQLPTAAAPETGLDLSLDVERADLFFFEYLFQDMITGVRGFTSGTAQIRGTLSRPVFDAEMRVADGRFALPRFGLSYRIDGDVDVDADGFTLRDVTVRDDDGSATIEGDILFNDYRFFSFDLRGVLDDIQIIDVARSQDLPFYGDIRASGPATLTGPLSDATLRSDDARTTPGSELFIPVSEGELAEDVGYILFPDSTGRLPDLDDLTRRDNILSDRPAGEPSFVDGLELDINVFAPEGSTVHLVFDPLVGDVVTAQGAGRVQLQRQEGEFLVYGTFDVSGGDYQFTAGEVFVRQFTIEDGSITWEGDPINASLDIDASYRTRASPAGLEGFENQSGRIPLRVELAITGDVEAPRVDLGLARIRDERTQLVGSQTLDAILNQPELATEYATSVLLTNTFLLTTSTLTQGNGAGEGGRLAAAGNQLAFNSVSQLVSSQLNRYLNEALPNFNVNLGVQGEDPEDLDITYGVALRLLDERLLIRGEGVYTGDDPDAPQQAEGGPQGEVVVEVRLNSRVNVEVFVRRVGDDLTRGQTLTRSAGAGLSYQTEFPTWKRLFYRLFGWLLPSPRPPATADTLASPPADSLLPSPVSIDSSVPDSVRLQPLKPNAPAAPSEAPPPRAPRPRHP